MSFYQFWKEEEVQVERIVANFSRSGTGSGPCGSYSGVEFNLKGLLREEGLEEESGMATVFTPIFFSDDSSVTEMERVKLGRTGGAESEKQTKESVFTTNASDLAYHVATVLLDES